MAKLYTRAEAVELLELTSPRALDRMVSKGAPKPKPGKRGSARYDVEALRAWRDARRERGAVSLDLQAERAKLARVQRHLTGIKIRQLKGTLVPRETVALLDSRRIASVRAAVLRLPTDAIQRGLPREHEALMRDLAEGILASLAATKWEDVKE